MTPPLSENGEERHDLLIGVADFLLILLQIGPQLQIFLYGQFGENLTALRNLNDTAGDDGSAGVLVISSP